MAIEQCPNCQKRLSVPRTFRHGRCPNCGATLTADRGRSSNPSPNPRTNPRPNPNQEQTAARKYEDFHQSKPRRIVRLPETLPEDWWLLGGTDRNTHIQYVPPSNSRLSGSLMDHAWGDKGGGSVQAPGAELYASADGKYLLIVSRTKGRFNVTSRGIEG